MNQEELQEMRRNITALIDDIKYHSDSLTPLERLPVIQLKVILAKINKLTEKTTILLHYVEKQGKLSDRSENPEITEIHRTEEKVTKSVEESPHIQQRNQVKTSTDKPVKEPEMKGPVKSQDVQAKLKKLKVSDLHSAIGINEKYLFASVLFGSNTVKFTEAIETINRMKEKSELISFLDELKVRYTWDVENETVQNFLELVERKFDQ